MTHTVEASREASPLTKRQPTAPKRRTAPHQAPLVVASDGSCLKNPGGAMGWAWADNRGRWQANGYTTGTNQQAELLGLLSIFYSFPNSDLHIQLDSQYVLNIATKWMFTWKKNNWWRNAAKTQAVSNLKFVRAIYEAALIRKKKGLKTSYEWVKGHSTNNLNNIADVKALNAAKRVKAGKPAYADSANNTESERQSRLMRSVIKAPDIESLK